jgi:ribosome-associated toxin RatA of RatAB toxin-antitoxin module
MSDEAHEAIRVQATPARCFGFTADFEEYPEWAKDVKRVTVLARDDQGRGSRVEYHASALGKSIRYVLDYDFTEAPRAFTWTLVDGDMLRALDGRYAFAPDGDGTLVTYDLHIDLSLPMPGIMKRRAGGLIVHNALQELKKAAEAS